MSVYPNRLYDLCEDHYSCLADIDHERIARFFECVKLAAQHICPYEVRALLHSLMDQVIVPFKIGKNTTVVPFIKKISVNLLVCGTRQHLPLASLNFIQKLGVQSFQPLPAVLIRQVDTAGHLANIPFRMV